MDPAIVAALTSYTGAWATAITDALPVVATAAVAVLTLKLGINFGLKYFKRFTK